MRARTLLILVTLLSLLASSNVALAHGGPGHDTTGSSHSQLRRELKQLKRATARFHSVKTAERSDYEEFLECFDSDEGGMGQHYVDVAALDANLELTHPEAMVYEVKRNGRLRLVAVEYIVPAPFVDPANPPSLFGQEFHLNTALDVWVLHVWIWKWNPAGLFSDWNPRVRSCPAG